LSTRQASPQKKELAMSAPYVAPDLFGAHDSQDSNEEESRFMRPRLYDSEEKWNAKLSEAKLDGELRKSLVQAARDLAQRGYAVIPGILTRDECVSAHDDFWKSMTIASGARIQRPYSAESLTDFKFTGNWPPNKHGIFEDGAWAHLPFVHEVRTHPRVVYSFASLYGAYAHEMVSSMDRINYQLPPEWLPREPPRRGGSSATSGVSVGPRGWPFIADGRSESAWLHFDQALNKDGRHCIQGLVTLTHAKQAGDASLEVVPYSHHLHGPVLRDILSDSRHKLPTEKMRSDWYMFSDEEKERMARAIHLKQDPAKSLFDSFRSVQAEAGSLILWDSRLMHQGGRIRASASCPRPAEPGRPRFVIYACHQPIFEFGGGGAAALPDKELAKKMRAVKEFKATSHWPLKVKLFPAPRTYGKEPAAFDFSRLVERIELNEGEAAPLLAQRYGVYPGGLETAEKIQDGVDEEREEELRTPGLRFPAEILVVRIEEAVDEALEEGLSVVVVPPPVFYPIPLLGFSPTSAVNSGYGPEAQERLEIDPEVTDDWSASDFFVIGAAEADEEEEDADDEEEDEDAAALAQDEERKDEADDREQQEEPEIGAVSAATAGDDKMDEGGEPNRKEEEQEEEADAEPVDRHAAKKKQRGASTRRPKKKARKAASESQ
jgi:hypothetical protein